VTARLSSVLLLISFSLEAQETETGRSSYQDIEAFVFVGPAQFSLHENSTIVVSLKANSPGYPPPPEPSLSYARSAS